MTWLTRTGYKQFAVPQKTATEVSQKGGYLSTMRGISEHADSMVLQGFKKSIGSKSSRSDGGPRVLSVSQSSEFTQPTQPLQIGGVPDSLSPPHSKPGSVSPPQCSVTAFPPSPANTVVDRLKSQQPRDEYGRFGSAGNKTISKERSADQLIKDKKSSNVAKWKKAAVKNMQKIQAEM